MIFFQKNQSLKKKKKKKKKIFFFEGNEGKGGLANVREFFYIKNPNLKKNFFLWVGGWGG